MYFFIEKGMKGDISCISKRFSKASNKYMKSYYKSKKGQFFVYLDDNNLFG